jgi:hypothetical protein
MTGGDTERFCAACDRAVYDLSVLTRRQALKLADDNGGRLCGRIHYDERGNQIFAKERSGIERLAQISVLGASAALSATASAAVAPGCEVKVRVVDPGGTSISNAAVRLSNADGAGAVSSGTSNQEGEFSDRIAPGAYSLEVKSPGFMAFHQELTCKAAEAVSVEAPLRVGTTLTGVIVMAKPESPILRRLHSLFRRH